MRKFSGAKAPRADKSLSAAPKRCYSRVRHCSIQGECMRSLCGMVTALSALATLVCLPALTQSSATADVIYIHGNVYTGVPTDAPSRSILRAEAIAVRGERILAVGKNAEIGKLKGLRTQVIDLGGNFVMPGFNDAHVH